MIGIIAGIAVVVALTLSLTQTPKYEASAALSFQDQSQALGLIGVPVAQVNTPAALAQTAAQTLVTPALLSSVQRALGTRQSIRQLQSEVSTAVQPFHLIAERHCHISQRQLCRASCQRSSPSRGHQRD